MARAALAECTELRELVFLPGPWRRRAHCGDPAKRGGTDIRRTAAAADDVAHSALQVRLADLDPHHPINLQYTSGTTGFPKGATLTHHNILKNGYSIGELLGYTEHDRVVLPVPFYHCLAW